MWKLTNQTSKFHISTQILRGNTLFSVKIYTAGKFFTRPPVATNFKSAGVIWGGLGMILVILECRITVCYKTICQIRNQLIASVASNWLQINLSPNRFAFWTSLLCTYILPLSCIGIDGLAFQSCANNFCKIPLLICGFPAVPPIWWISPMQFPSN